MGRFNHKKVITSNLNADSKIVKIPHFIKTSEGLPVFHFNKIDRDGPFAFSPCRSCFDTDAGKSKHHFLSNLEGLSKEAKKRLSKLGLEEETDCLYSFAFDNTLRIIGLRCNDDFYILWYDQNHEVCPSHKKHT